MSTHSCLEVRGLVSLAGPDRGCHPGRQARPNPLAHGPPGAPEARRLYHRPTSFPVIELSSELAYVGAVGNVVSRWNRPVSHPEPPPMASTQASCGVKLASPFPGTSIETASRDARGQTARACPRVHAPDVGYQPRPRSSIPRHAVEVRRDGTATPGPSDRWHIPGTLCRRPRPDLARASEHVDGHSPASRGPG